MSTKKTESRGVLTLDSYNKFVLPMEQAMLVFSSLGDAEAVSQKWDSINHRNYYVRVTKPPRVTLESMSASEYASLQLEGEE